MSSSQGSGCSSIFLGKPKPKDIKFQHFEEDPGLKPGDLPYAVNAQFLSPAEGSFYRLAVQVLQEKYTVCPKVSMAELLFATNGDQAAKNRIIQKRIDFVVCETQTMKPVYAIELDDKSHNAPQRQERDKFLDAAFKAAGLPLVHIENKAGYSREELIMQLLQPLGNIKSRAVPVKQKTELPVDQTVLTPPRCPKCGQPMVMRTGSVGAHAGKKFWGCSNYPNCTAIIPIFEY
jgi:hypothetical protein